MSHTAPTPPQPRQLFWIDVRDHMPDDETTVLVAMPDGEITTAWHADDCWREAASATLIKTVTHWADLPEPPNSTTPWTMNP
jgi:hypothetical protein